MPMPVVDVRVVWMLVRQHLVPMRVHVRLLSIPRDAVLMPMMFIVKVLMGMLERLMRVLVLMPLFDVKPDPEGHQRAGRPEQR